MKRGTFKMIPAVDAGDFPRDVEDWCTEQEISTHYQNDIAYIEDDGNPLAEWLKEIGVEFEKDKYRPERRFAHVAIFAT